jgi:aspartokinase/homoserine dehydrogenase 1
MMGEYFLLIVMKFGGRSVGGAEALRNVVALISNYASANDVVVVASAMNGVTNSLIQAATRASQRDEKHVAEVTEQLRTRHENVVNRLSQGQLRSSTQLRD